MSTHHTKYPYFDLSEIVPDNDLLYKKYKALKPVKTGNTIPDFKLSADFNSWQQFYNGAPTYGSNLIKQLINGPLVIAFYSHHWGSYGLDQLKQLNNIQYEIKANGGNLLIINADGYDSELEKTVWENNLTLNFYHDHKNELAQKFRVYSEEDPTWNKFAGIDVNVPLLATYVIDTARNIVFSHIDDLSGTFNYDNIVFAVHEAAYLINRRKSA